MSVRTEMPLLHICWSEVSTIVVCLDKIGRQYIDDSTTLSISHTKPAFTNSDDSAFPSEIGRDQLVELF